MNYFHVYFYNILNVNQGQWIYGRKSALIIITYICDIQRDLWNLCEILNTKEDYYCESQMPIYWAGDIIETISAIKEGSLYNFFPQKQMLTIHEIHGRWRIGKCNGIMRRLLMQLSFTSKCRYHIRLSPSQMAWHKGNNWSKEILFLISSQSSVDQLSEYLNKEAAQFNTVTKRMSGTHKKKCFMCSAFCPYTYLQRNRSLQVMGITQGEMQKPDLMLQE